MERSQSSRSFGTGSLLYHVRDSGRPTNEISLDDIPTEKLRALADRDMQTAAEQKHKDSVTDAIGIWHTMHPECLDTPYNGAQMREYLDAHDIKYPTIEDLDAAFLWKAKYGLMQLDEKALSDKKRQQWEQRAKEITADQFSEEKAQAMPMNELEARARGWK